MIPLFSFFLIVFRSMLRRLRSPALLVLLLAGLLVLVLASSCFFPTNSDKALPANTARVVFAVSEPFAGSWDKLGTTDNPASRKLSDSADDSGAKDHVDGSRALVYDPAPLPGELQVFLEGIGPGDAVLALVQITGPVLELDLVAGDWVFQARAVDGEGSAFLAGTAAATVKPATGAMVVIELSPVPGPGSLTIAYSAPTDATDSAVWNCHLTDHAGTIVAAWEDLLVASGRTVSDIPSGYYLLASRLFDGELLLSGKSDLVRVLAGRSTAVSVAVAIPLAGAGLDVQLDHQAPAAISAALLSRAAVRGFPLRVRATGPAEFSSGLPSGFSSEADFLWSAMGMPLAQGELVDIPTLGLPRSGLIDLVAFSGTSAGATALAYSLAEPAVKDSWCLYATVGLSAEPASQILGRPAMVAASQPVAQATPLDGSSTSAMAAGTILAVASDGTSSKLELWMPDPAKDELVPGASTTIRIGGTAKRATILTISGDGSYVGAAASESSWIWLAPVALDGSLGAPVEFAGGSGELSGMGYVRGLVFSPAADRLYALSNADRSVYVFQRSGTVWSLLQRFTLDDLPCGILSVLRTLAISNDGSRLAVAAASSDVVVILDVVAGGLLWRSEARRSSGFPDIDYPQALAFCPGGTPDGMPSGSGLAVGCKDSAALVILDVEAVPPVAIAVRKAPDGLPGSPASLSWSADGQFIGLTTEDAAGIVRLDTGDQPRSISVFSAADASGLAAPTGLAMVGDSLYLACPDAQVLVILGHLAE